MPSVRLYPNNMRKYVEELYDQIYNSDYDKARDTARKLLRDIVKYTKTRGYDCRDFYEMFHELDFTLRVCSDGQNKKEILADILEKIVKKIQNPTGNPLHQLEDLYNELLKYPIGEKNIQHIKNILVEILELEPIMKNLDMTRQNYYALLKQEVAKYHATLTEISVAKPGKETLGKATQQLSNVLTAIQRVITPLVKIELPKEQLVRLAKGGVPIGEVAKVTGYSEDELRMMLAQARAEVEGGESS